MDESLSELKMLKMFSKKAQKEEKSLEITKKYRFCLAIDDFVLL